MCVTNSNCVLRDDNMSLEASCWLVTLVAEFQFEWLFNVLWLWGLRDAFYTYGPLFIYLSRMVILSSWIKAQIFENILCVNRVKWPLDHIIEPVQNNNIKFIS